MEQDSVDTQSLLAVKKVLVSEHLLFHKDKMTKILVACCLADILRLFAPDAPYNENELRVRILMSDFAYLAGHL